MTLLCATLLGLAATALATKLEARASSTSSATATSSGSLPAITITGNAFYSGSDRFYIRGIDYQPGGSSSPVDPLADYSTCSRDIPYFKQLGLNTIRVYTVDNSANHDQCMGALADAGIYLALDINTPKYSLNRGDPSQSYNPTYLQSIFATVDAFAGYSNTLLFFSGNEVINAQNTTTAAPYIKAVTRDMKQYISERGYRKIPVGYSAADVSQNQYSTAQYMDCGEAQTISDFYAINNYEWCDPSSFSQAGWDTLVQQYSNYSLPLFFSEYGCITNTRTFAETTALYQTDMTAVFSGGLVYQYSEEGAGYGIVSISGNTVTPIGSQFSDLQSALNSTSNPSGNGGAQTSSGSEQSCPASSADWSISPFTGNALPATPSGAEQYFKSGAGTGPGLTGSGSQNSGGGSTVTASAGAGSATATYGSGSASGTSSASASASHTGAAWSLKSREAGGVGAVGFGVVVGLSFLFGAALMY
ncbi:beta-glucanosyltransferase [Meristemomyces frigidus]|uniref:1,3-beta-glucanosyltransferase n=1 Tax=Meristemomyces frigidus TaxID=1508187 RepID=A0AAN7TPL0_9PEZI|nr:beta-glucanosyltransferase [Meristemomyces frigidus]